MIELLIIGIGLILLGGVLFLAIKKSNKTSHDNVVVNKPLKKELKEQLNTLRKVAGIDTGQGIVSRQPFMEEYNYLNITKELIDKLKNEILSSFKYNEKRKLKNKLSKTLDDNLAKYKLLSSKDKTGYGQIYLSFHVEDMQKKKELLDFFVDLHKILEWCNNTLFKINTSVKPRELIRSEFEKQIKICNDSIIEDYIKVKTFNDKTYSDIEFNILAMCVRINKFKQNCEKFDEQYAKNEQYKKDKDAIKKRAYINPKLYYSSIHQGYDSITNEDINKSILLLHEIYKTFEDGNIQPKNKIYSLCELDDIKPLSLIASDNDKKEFTSKLLNYFLIAKEYNILLQESMMDSNDRYNETEYFKQIKKLNDNFNFCAQQLCFYANFDESHEYHNSCTVFNSYGTTNALSIDLKMNIEDIKDKLLKAIVQQHQLATKIK